MTFTSTLAVFPLWEIGIATSPAEKKAKKTLKIMMRTRNCSTDREAALYKGYSCNFYIFNCCFYLDPLWFHLSASVSSNEFSAQNRTLFIWKPIAQNRTLLIWKPIEYWTFCFQLFHWFSSFLILIPIRLDVQFYWLQVRKVKTRSSSRPKIASNHLGWLSSCSKHYQITLFFQFINR